MKGGKQKVLPRPVLRGGIADIRWPSLASGEWGSVGLKDMHSIGDYESILVYGAQCQLARSGIPGTLASPLI
jgi:hypothetical protein